jgi:GT2 family glycosyltransferase
VDSITTENVATIARGVARIAEAPASARAWPIGGRRTLRRALRLARTLATWLGWAARGELRVRVGHWRRQRAAAAAIMASPLFDAAWYARSYRDVDPADAARHYVRRGAAEGRSPGPDFDGPWYLRQHPDAAQTGWNPLLHYLSQPSGAGGIRKLVHPLPPARAFTTEGYAAWLRDWDAAAGIGLAAGFGQADTAGLIAIAHDGDVLPDQPWCLLLAGDVALAPAARHLLAEAMATPGVDLITADEDVCLPDGSRVHPRLQPAWDPDLLRAAGYIGSGVAVRRTVLLRLGLARLPDLPTLLLRLADTVAPARALHVPAVLFHAPAPPVWPLAAAQRMLATQGIAAEPGPVGTLRLRHQLPDPAPLVSILIPTRDQADLLGRCARGLLHATDYPAMEIIILDNGSTAPSTARLLRRLQEDPRVRVISDPAPFDWSALNNRGAAAARGELLLLLNNDVMVREPGWLREMVTLALRPEVGAVGATLLYPSGRIQHAGVALHPPGLAVHVMRHAPAAVLDDAAPAGCPADTLAGAEAARLRAVRAVAAVTGACLMLRKDVFDAVGGLTAGTLRVSWNDIDLCLRLRARGLRVLCTPFARLTHLEGATRGGDHSPARLAELSAEYAYMVRVWGDALSEDPHLNRNFALIDERLALASPPLWQPTGDLDYPAKARASGPRPGRGLRPRTPVRLALQGFLPACEQTIGRGFPGVAGRAGLARLAQPFGLGRVLQYPA